jgi:hypothetical protein|tara:strand:+ start:4487 stop:4852 length:366 start_codon:yes stop_codon:yes gene_type:complete
MKNKGKIMNLETYLENNNRDTSEIKVLFQVHSVIDTINGNVFKILENGDIDFSNPTSVLDMKYDWFDKLAFGEDKIVDEVMARVGCGWDVDVDEDGPFITSSFDEPSTLTQDLIQVNGELF